MHVLRSLRIPSVALILAVLTSCGGGGGGSTPPPPPPPPRALSVTPATASVAANGTVTLIPAGGTSPYTYAVTAGTGAVSATGVYTAPPTAGTATVTVTDAAGTRVTAAITVIVNVSISPASITMPASSGQTYAFAGKDGTGTYQFALLSGPGSITTGGVYTAGTRSGTATVQVTDGAGGTATATVKSVFVRTNGPVQAAVSDGTSWYLGGSFSAVNAYPTPHLAVLDLTSGAPNLACDLQDGFDGDVLTTVSDGTALYVGGRFAHYRGVDTPGGLVKIDPATCQVVRTFFLSTDQADYTSALFVSGTSLLVNAHAQRYRGGLASTSAAFTLMRLDTTTGNRDPAFQVTLPIAELQTIFATTTSVYAGIFKLDAATGTWDQTFSIPFNSVVYAYAATGTSLYLGGTFSDGGGSVRKVDINTGAIDPAFSHTGTLEYVYSLALAGNALYVSGTFDKYATVDRPGLAKLDATTGALDATFLPPGSFLRPIADGGVHAMVFDNGSLYVTGNFRQQGNSPATNVAKLNGTTGAIDTTFTKAVGLSDTGLSLVKVGTSLFAGGKFVTYRGAAASNLAKLNIATGVADPAFTGGGTDGRVNALALNNGALFLGGDFATCNGAAAQRLAKINATTAAVDTGFTRPDGGTDGPVRHIATEGTRLFITGEFVLYRNTVTYGLAKLSLANGALDPNYVSGFSTNFVGPVELHGAYLYTSAPTTSYGSLHNPVFDRIDAATGALDVNFPGVPAATQFNIAVTFQGNTGYASFLRFTPAGGNPVSSVVKFDGNTGTVDTGFATAFDQVFTPIMALRAVGTSVYLAATPVQFAGDGYGYFLGKLNATTGALDTTFATPSTTTNGTIRALETTGTDLWVGGEFSRYRGAPAYYFVPVDPVTGALSDP